jgi:30S ribosomal protein S31
MGKGDKKSKRGKISMGSYGISRPRNKKKNVAVQTVKPEKKEKKVVEAAPEVVEAVVKPAKKPAAKKPKKETKETAE